MNLEEQMARCISQRENLEAILNSVGDGILAANRDLVVQNLNEAASEILGWSREDAVGRTCAAVFPCLDGSGKCALGTDQPGDKAFKERKVEIRRLDGEKRSLFVTVHALKSNSGSTNGFVVVFRDLTELETLRSSVRGVTQFERLVGKSATMRDIYQLIEDVAETDTTVLILGESGTGKELVAEAIHKRSHRKNGPFVRVNCSALPENLLESELFGHVRGAFTGAIKDKRGRFERAQGGTLFLDEIGDVSIDAQVRLLRVLQEKEFERVGGTETIQTNVRIITATHQNLQSGIQKGSFREDLFYRLYVMPIELPPLRRRMEDVPLLLEQFVTRFRAETGKRIEGLSAEALRVVMDYAWPGNVRELENAVEHAFVKCRSGSIEVDDLPGSLVAAVLGDDPVAARSASRNEKELLQAVLEKSGWNQSKAARTLGLHRTTVWRKMRDLGIVPPDTR